MAWKRDKRTTTISQYISYWIAFAVMVVYTILLMYPFLWAFSCSLMEAREFFSKIGQIFVLPDKMDFTNYVAALNTKVLATDSSGITRQFGIFDMVGNTVFMTIARTIIGMVCPICSAYCCAKYKFLGSKFFFYYGVVFCGIPFYGGVSAVFEFIHRLNLYDTVGGVLFLSINTFGGFLFYYGFFRGVSWEYAEAAFIDGASDLRVFLHIMLPQVFPILFTFLVNGFIANWNDWMTNYLYLPSKPMIAYGVYMIQEQATVTSNWSMLFAAIFLSLSVPLVFFLAFSKRILSTVYTGGLKG